MPIRKRGRYFRCRIRDGVSPPVRFDREAESGRNKPLRVVVETSDAIGHEAFLKASARPELGVEGVGERSDCGDLGLPMGHFW